MDYPVTIEGFEGREVIVRTGKWGGAPQLLLDGEPAPAGPKRNQFLLPRPDGTETLVKFRTGFFDPVPQVQVEGKVMNVTPPLAWHEQIWCLLPLLLVFTPGIDGIILAFAGGWLNTQLFRSERPLTQKYLLTAAVSLAMGGLYLLFSGQLRLPA